MKFSILTVLAICTSFWYATATPVEIAAREAEPPTADGWFPEY
ncbi:hypothetical protein EW026_g6645 [Hermanssonia centrifuga]|uniref:Uncharacterized protein n=1 Tax=Hermanssonia centrifuga TaxID=98765 RepID=A0A4S4KAD8_9APHY|nr:hypothetical protein EW026_g6645 [Hermanssonia centrifuga]